MRRMAVREKAARDRAVSGGTARFRTMRHREARKRFAPDGLFCGAILESCTTRIIDAAAGLEPAPFPPMNQRCQGSGYLENGMLYALTYAATRYEPACNHCHRGSEANSEFQGIIPIGVKVG